MNNAFRNSLQYLSAAGDVAALIGIPPNTLEFYCFPEKNPNRYTTFEIPKRSGGKRKISAPCPELKDIQQKLCRILIPFYHPPDAAHGFIKGRSIITNAKPHCDREFVFNIDLQDFFPTINLGRVMGLLRSPSIGCAPNIAAILGNLCCHENKLPQGAPTSPLISNMICYALDERLLALSARHDCTYTRFADDITFSCDQDRFPEAIAARIQSGEWHVAPALRDTITSMGFQINEAKVRMQTRHQRQEVTGLVTNSFPNVRRSYVRETRAMLHAWEKYGLENARQTYRKKTSDQYRNPNRPRPDFQYVMLGKVLFIYMVKGANDPIAIKLRDRLCALVPSFSGAFRYMTPTPTVLADEIVKGLPPGDAASRLTGFQKDFRQILRDIDASSKERITPEKDPEPETYDNYFHHFVRTIEPKLHALNLDCHEAQLAFAFGEQWNLLPDSIRRQVATSFSLAITSVKDYLRPAITELCLAIEASINQHVFLPLKECAIPDASPLEDPYHREGYTLLSNYIKKDWQISLGQQSRLITSAISNRHHGLFMMLMDNMETLYPTTSARIIKLISDLTVAKPGEIHGLQKSIVDIRNACSHDNPCREDLATINNYSGIWRFALKEPLELLFLLNQPCKLNFAASDPTDNPNLFELTGKCS